MKNPSPRAAEWACEGVEGSNRAHLRLPGAGHDRQPGRDLTMGSVRGYESDVLKVKKEIPVEIRSASKPGSNFGFANRVPLVGG